MEHAIAHIEESIAGLVDDRYLRWYAIKVFERDDKVMAQLKLTGELKAHLEAHIADCEKELDDDAESIITNQRYAYINGVGVPLRIPLLPQRFPPPRSLFPSLHLQIVLTSCQWGISARH